MTSSHMFYVETPAFDQTTLVPFVPASSWPPKPGTPWVRSESLTLFVQLIFYLVFAICKSLTFNLLFASQLSVKLHTAVWASKIERCVLSCLG